MKKLSVIALAVLSIVVFTCGYTGAEDSGRTPWYASASVGFSHLNDVQDAGAHDSFYIGPAISAALGMRLENLDNKFLQNFRVEAEYAQQFFPSREIDPRIPAIFQGMASTKGTGRGDIQEFQTVIYYDFPLRKFTAVQADSFVAHLTPFVGIGFGFDRSILHDISSPLADWASVNLMHGHRRYNLNTESDFVYCWAPRIGISYELGKHFDTFLGFRYNQSNNLMVNGNGQVVTNTNIALWSTELGVRYTF